MNIIEKLSGMRRLLKVLAVVTPLLLSTMAMKAENMAVGTWKVYPIFAVPPQKVIDTGNIVYYTAGGNLFSYDVKNEETYSYTSGNKLSGNNIDNIFYDYNHKFLLICYSDGNMDTLDDEGRVVNLSDIIDSTVGSPYKVNDVEFDGDDMYLATNFGLVQYNIPRREVVQSGIYGKDVTGVTVMGDKLVIYADSYIKFIKKGSRLHSYDKFHNVKKYNPVRELIALDSIRLMPRTASTDNFLCVQRIKFLNDTVGVDDGWGRLCAVHTNYPDYVSRNKDGEIYFQADGKIYMLDKSNNYKEKLLATLDEESAAGVSGTIEGISKVWSLTNDGISLMTLHPEGGMTVKIDRFRPEDFSVKNVCMLVPSSDHRRLYAQNLGPTGYRFGLGDTPGTSVVQQASVIDLESGRAEDITTYPVEAAYGSTAAMQKRLGKYIIGPACIAENPKDASVHYVGTSQDGLIKISNGEFAGRYTSANAPFAAPWGWRVYGVSFDRGGNMWTHSHSKPWINILPAAKLSADPADVKPEDWYTPKLPDNFTSQMDVQWLQCRKSNMIFLIHRNTVINLLAINTKGTYNNFEDDEIYAWGNLTDQDGNIFAPDHFTCLAEDNEGHVWIGSTNGIIEISNPSQATNPAMRVNRLKVPRNDGTNMADYLLAGETVWSIAVDGANRKWVGTENSGLVLVGADGHSVIDIYNTDNSPLTTNMVNAVYADPRGSNIYAGTNDGLFVYSTDATPGMEDYSEVYAYPNPVRPDFHGTIYIKGLMDNSLIKIADVSGNVVSQGRAEGGMYGWDGCNASGTPVKTGVYYVFMSQNASGNTAAVTKIMIVR